MPKLEANKKTQINTKKTQITNSKYHILVQLLMQSLQKKNKLFFLVTFVNCKKIAKTGTSGLYGSWTNSASPILSWQNSFDRMHCLAELI